MGGKVGRIVKAVATGGASELIGGSAQKAPDINIPQPIAQPGAPTIDDARLAAEKSDMLRRRRGRAATILTGTTGDTSAVNVGTKTLLGG